MCVCVCVCVCVPGSPQQDVQNHYVGSYDISRNSLVTARKRRLNEGNVFTPFCQSFCSRGRVFLYDVTFCLATWFHVPSRGRGLSAQVILCKELPQRILLECFPVYERLYVQTVKSSEVCTCFWFCSGNCLLYQNSKINKMAT